MVQEDVLTKYLELYGRHSLINGKTLDPSEMAEIGAMNLRGQLLGKGINRTFTVEKLVEEFSKIGFTTTEEDGKRLIKEIHLAEAQCGSRGYVYFERISDEQI